MILKGSKQIQGFRTQGIELFIPKKINITNTTPNNLTDIFGGEISTVLESQFDASQQANFISPNPSDGDTFTQWTESNNGTRNANPIGGGGTRPTYQSGAGDTQNNLEVVRFDGVDDGLSINPYPNLASKSGITIFVILKMNEETLSINNNNPRIVTTNILNGIALYYNSSSNKWTVAASAGAGESTITNDHTKFNLHTLIYDGTQTGNSNRLKYKYNKTEEALTFTGTVGTTTNAGITTLYIANNNAANYFGGDIAEILIFTRTLTASEISGVETLLSNKWGL